MVISLISSESFHIYSVKRYDNSINDKGKSNAMPNSTQ